MDPGRRGEDDREDESSLPSARHVASITRRRRDVANYAEFGQRREVFNRQAAYDRLRNLRLKDDFKPEPHKQQHNLWRFIREPYLNLGLAIANEIRVSCGGVCVVGLRTFHEGDD